MRDGTYVVLQSFMLNDLHLKGNELIVYAVIFGYTQDGEHWYYGTKGHLAEWCGSSKGTVGNCLKSLVEKGFVERKEVHEHGQTRYEYRVTKFDIPPYKICDTPHTKFGTVNNKEEQPNENKEDIAEIPYSEIVEYLNKKAGTRYRPSTWKTRSQICVRWNEGFTLDDFKRVIDVKCAEWLGTDMAKYLRPETLFGTKMESYLNQPVSTRGKGRLNDYNYR